MKKIATLLSALLMTGGTVVTASQTYVAAATEAKTSTVTVGLTEGTINLISVPDIDFGSEDLSATELLMVQKAKNQNVSVSDSRGSGAGYKVDVALESQFKTTDGRQLTGSTLTINNEGGSSTDIDPSNPATDGQKTNAVLEGAGSKGEIVNAEENHGLGTWNYNIAMSAVHIIPGVYAGDYAGTLKWTLTAGPTA